MKVWAMRQCATAMYEIVIDTETTGLDPLEGHHDDVGGAAGLMREYLRGS